MFLSRDSAAPRGCPANRSQAYSRTHAAGCEDAPGMELGALPARSSCEKTAVVIAARKTCRNSTCSRLSRRSARNLGSARRMHARHSVLQTPHVDQTSLKINLIPANCAQLPRPESMPVRRPHRSSSPTATGRALGWRTPATLQPQRNALRQATAAKVAKLGSALGMPDGAIAESW